LAAALILSLVFNGLLAFSDAVQTAVAGAASAVGLVTVLAAERAAHDRTGVRLAEARRLAARRADSAARATAGLAAERAASRKLRDANARLTDSAARTSARLAAERAAHGETRERLAETERVADRRAKKLARTSARRAALAATLKKRNDAGKRAVAAARRANARILKTAGRLVAVMPAKAIPYGGAAVIAGATAWEIRDMCVTTRDINELAAALAPEGAADRGEPAVCGMEVPDRRELLEAATAVPEKAWNRAREALGGLGSIEAASWLAMEFPDIPPDALELWRELAERSERWWSLWRRGGE